MLSRVFIVLQLVSLGAIIVCSFLLARYGGLISEEITDGMVLSSTLQGSGAKDDLVLGFGAILTLPLVVLRIIKIQKKPSILENLATIGICGLQFILIKLGLEISSISDTVKRSGNSVVIFWLIGYSYLVIQAFLRLLTELLPSSAQR